MSAEQKQNKSSSTVAEGIMNKFAEKTLQDYEVLSVMGNGAFGTCYKVRDKATGELYAWKGMNYDELDDAQSESLISEISVLRQLQHPNIVQYYHHLINREAKSIYIVMECCAGGDLAQLIKKARTQRQRFDERYIWRVLFQLCRALQLCHNTISAGTILHRDIKPANIFLDAAGNAKLGDFGLARMLRRDQSFAASFVGTPHYMSPELVKGRQYDRKSDVWAVGCLIYELCALRPPFRGSAFPQLSANIAQGQFASIPAVYSADLQQIISCMLAVEHEQRPGIEVITRHPLLARNISEAAGPLPQLIAAEEDFYVPALSGGKLFQASQDNVELSSTMFTEQYSFNEGYGQRRLSITGVFTPDLRQELFYSARRRIFANGKKQQQSDPALYESIRREEAKSPGLLTQGVFDEALQQRLHAIRAQEALLQQRAAELQARADSLQMAEQRLQALEEQLAGRGKQCHCQQREPAPPPPPVPPRRPTASHHDDTYCTIELNETSPTVAKMNLAALPAPLLLRKMVTFQSPPKLLKLGAENVPPPVPWTSVSSKGSDDSADSQASATRRKSILALFGLSRGSKTAKAAAAMAPPAAPAAILRRPPLAVKATAQQQPPQPTAAEKMANIWTKEQKRAAFDMLAAMNAAEKGNSGGGGCSRSQLRQSVRERNSTLQRSRQRRSLILGGGQQRPLVAVPAAPRDQLLL